MCLAFFQPLEYLGLCDYLKGKKTKEVKLLQPYNYFFYHILLHFVIIYYYYMYIVLLF